MLYYNVYSNLSDEEYIIFRERLIVIEQMMIKELLPLGWKLTSPVAKNDGLIIDFTIDEEIFSGNLGLDYDDKPEADTFSFYATKGFDEGLRRYFKKEIVFKEKELAFYENKIKFLLAEVLNLYRSWRKQDVIGS